MIKKFSFVRYDHGVPRVPYGRTRLWAVALIGFAALIAVWWFGGRGPANETASAEKPVMVILATVEQRTVPVTLQINGSVTSLNSVSVHPQLERTVRTVHVKEGDFVDAGQLLITLDDRADQASLQMAQAQLKKDQATLADYERQHRRSQELVAQDFIAQSAADSTLSQLQAQQAVIAADQAAIRAAQVTLDHTRLRAPIRGRLGAINVYPGSLVSSSISVVTITQLNPIAVSFPVPENQLAHLLSATQSGMQVQARIPGAGQPMLGKLDFVDNTVDASVGTIRAKAIFDNADHRLWPGQFVEVRAVLRTLDDIAVLPVSAVMQLPQGSVVYVVGEDMRAQQRSITVEHVFDGKVAAHGIEPGLRVVVEGAQNLRPGALVQVQAPSASTAP